MLKVTEHLSSTKNPRVKNIQLLQKHRERMEQGLFVLEGPKEIERAHHAGYEFTTIFFVPEMFPQNDLEKFITNFTEVFSISSALFEKLTYRGNTGGMLVLAKQKDHKLENLNLKTNPLIVVLEALEKPGNLGAILRTADAAAVDAVIVCDPHTDIYNPNVVRSSIGCLFTVPVAVATSDELIHFLKSRQINIYCTALSASVPYQTIDYTQGSAIVMGTEATGLTNKWLNASTKNIIIPMGGIADSLNVSTSAAIVIFEAVRQRGF